MSANQFRLFLAGVIVVGVLGWIGWNAIQSQSRIGDCVAAFGWTRDTPQEARAMCAARERAGKLRTP